MSHETIVNLIAATTTKAGLKVTCELDQSMYPSGIKFINASVGLKTMTPEGYDAVISRIGPAAEKLAAQGANATGAC